MKITKRGIVAALLIFLSILLGTTTETGFSLGDKLLSGLGIPPWTDGNRGFHLSIVIWFVVFLIGVLEAKRVMSGPQIVLLVLFLLMLSPSVLSYIKPIYYGMQNGLAAVEYDASNTHFRYKSSEDGKNIEMIGAIALTNYGDSPLVVSIKMPSERFKGWVLESEGDLALRGSQDSAMPDSYTLYPGKKETLLSYSIIPLRSTMNGAGTMGGPDLILCTDKETRVVGE